MRQVAFWASHRSGRDFNRGWPEKNQGPAAVIDINSPGYGEWYAKIKQRMKPKDA